MQTTLERYRNRDHAGQLLAERLLAYADRDDALVLALPRGGVPVAYAIASRLRLPLDIVLVRKLGFPGHEEYAMGAVASGGACVLQSDALRAFQVPSSVLEATVERALAEIERRELRYRRGRQALPLRERCVIIADDGMATGSTMLVAVQLVRAAQPRQIIAAVPVCAPDALGTVRAAVDQLICLATPEPFHAVGMWYDDFTQTGDEQVVALLDANGEQVARRTGACSPIRPVDDAIAQKKL